MINLSETDESESDADWQVYKHNKRNITRSPSSQPNKKRAFNENEPSTSNRFEVLSDVMSEEEDLNNTTTSNATAMPKPPPLFIPYVTNITKMIKSFYKVIPTTDFSFKALKNDQVKVMTKTVESYKKLVEYCKKKEIQFHTYQLKTERSFRVVVKNLHHSTPEEQIKTALELEGHKVRNIMNIRSRITKQPLPLFFVDLEPSEDNKKVYEIKSINNAIVHVEPPRKVKELVQCYRCQQFGHTKAYCTKPFRCVKCGNDHPTAECQKNKENPPTCSNCNENHPANYRGCRVYQRILKSRQDINSNIQHSFHKYNQQYAVTQNEFPQLNQNQYNYNYNKNAASYADAVRTNTSSFEKLESLIQKQIEQTNNLLQMITLLVTKLCK